MSDWSEKLNIAHNYQSWASMARETGLPVRVINAIRTGVKEPPSGYSGVLNNIWKRASYRWMLSAGTPIKQATIVRGASLKTVSDTYDLSSRLLKLMTEGAALLKFAHLKQPYKSSLFRQYLQEMEPIIRKGMNESVTETGNMPSDYGYMEKFLELNPEYTSF